MKINFILHPGYIRTGTTFLQNNVFSKLNDIINIGKPYQEKSILSNLNNKLFCKKEDIKNLINYDKLIDTYVNLLLKNIKETNKNTIIFSDESLLDFEFYDPISNLVILKKIFDKLNDQVDLNLKVILTIRRQHDLISSRYSYLFPFYKKNYPEIDSFINKPNLEQKKFFDSLKYQKISTMIIAKLNCYLQYFIYEQLKDNPIIYINNVQKILENNKKINEKNFSKVNVNSYEGAHYLRKSNIWFKIYKIIHSHYKKYWHESLKNSTFKEKISEIFYNKIRFTNKNSKLVKLNEKQIFLLKDYYSQNNIELDKNNSLELKKYGYY